MIGWVQPIRRNCRVTNVTDDGPASLLHRRYRLNDNFALHYLSLMAGGAALIPDDTPAAKGARPVSRDCCGRTGNPDLLPGICWVLFFTTMCAASMVEHEFKIGETRIFSPEAAD
jgi:hypothetical protein